MTTTDVEEDLDVKSLSVVRVTYHTFCTQHRSIGLSENRGRARERVGNWLLKEVSGRAKLLTKATKMEETGRGISVT
jgi:hypothetical protein